MRIEFEQVHLYTALRGKCRFCGKYCQRTKEFMQTLNPWNKKDGHLKTREEIYEELNQERREWIARGPAHEKCERAAKRAEVEARIAKEGI